MCTFHVRLCVLFVATWRSPAEVPLTLRDVFRGVEDYTYMFPRLEICPREAAEEGSAASPGRR